MNIRLIKNAALYLSIGLFALSLSQRSYCVNNDCGELWSGLAVFISGAFGWFSGGVNLTWLANPLLFYTWRVIGKNINRALVLSFISTLLSISFLFFKNIMVDEAGTIDFITGYGLGYWLWLSSCATMFCGSLILKFLINRKTIE